jgi:DNA-binding NarL/FixJ family response regulator/Holliday junction resolvase-like predicted endonuclease
MEKTVLIIDDEVDQATGLQKALSLALPQYHFEHYSSEQDIMSAIEHRYYSLAVVDLRMDKYAFNGIELIKKIFVINPFAKVIIVSAFKNDYFNDLKELLLTGKIVDILEKDQFKILSQQLATRIHEYYNNLDKDPSEINNALQQFYAEAKNEKDTYNKGERFEHFISLLFQSFGYKDVTKRVKDKSLNEVDLIIRNETDDTFLNKFGKYILVECKNKPSNAVTKNDFIVFAQKLKNTNGLAELGIIATSGYISWNTYIEAIRTSGDLRKILFISNPEIEQLIRSADKKEEFKRLIDAQVKDN